MQEYIGLNMDDAVRLFRVDYLNKWLEMNRWNVNKTADNIGISRRHLYKLIKEYGINLPSVEDPIRGNPRWADKDPV